MENAKLWKKIYLNLFGITFLGWVGSFIGLVWGDSAFWGKMIATHFILFLLFGLLSYLQMEVVKDEEKKQQQ